MNTNIKSVVIVGAGPVGSTLAALLVSAGKEVVFFDTDKRPEMVVGESLIPAIVPILRRLGIEEEIKSFSTHKPGATFLIDDVESHYGFGEFGDKFPGYAYNVPREKFDAALVKAAENAGAISIHESAKVQFNSDTGKMELSPETLETVKKHLSTGQPDLIVDASGRRRLFSNLAEIPSTAGKRTDTVLFAHIESANTTMPGNIHIGRLTHGWNWFIPIPGKMSAGIVMDNEQLEHYGSNIEERFDTLFSQKPALQKYVPNLKRLTKVMKYTNYQWVSNRLYGDGWVLVGDAAGFVDPVFSSGLFLGMHGATTLADAIIEGNSNSLAQYQKDYFDHIRSWQHIVDYYYTGELFTLFITGRDRPKKWYSKPFRSHVYRHMGRIFTGQAATQNYSLRLLDFMTKYAIKAQDYSKIQIN